ncbi:choice-of-anchor L family PEP-CTERM protein [Nodularia sphaerocarpa]|uniref:choice-of-anchor L family PEP-CTERM protein n=1 Tax=Nodularia sphaerocarpa TaxID=137816 RepID=UPI001EFA8D86|nr:PEP-CTERM sorting domain-containing protein [Nodularia sphaerocarpa]MDB9375470.1 PEP-CTERM sorting domain-containing protein [Nodularia sphaerocarpa CS-585]MDB9379317.1 PEP-CTERM sorting domain-containing protein [Nodularia sphaerocarpa CS-585A2]ULP71970.1 hypothetical protein BDGGKGIB_01607 [Nodularia sphaerocarpa UHCC 0038]
MNSLSKFLSRSAFTLVSLGIAAVPAHALNITTTGDPNDLVNTILGGGITLSNATYTGAPDASGTFINGLSSGIGIDRGIILTTGFATRLATGTVTPLPEEPGVDFFDVFYDPLGEDNLATGDDDLSNLIGQDTINASVLEFDFISETGDLFINYVFASQEYPIFVNSRFNDLFAFFLEGENLERINIALIPGTTTPVSINTVNNGNPNPQRPNDNTVATNPEFFNNNNTGNFNNGFNGFTEVFTAQATGLVPGDTYKIKLAIADVFDQFFDSAVFIESGSFSDTPVEPELPVTPETPVTSVPEPTTILGLLALGAFGISTDLKRKQKHKAVSTF